MKNYKLPLMGFGLVLLITSCKKEDVRPVNTSKADSEVTTTNSWNTLTSWSKVKANDSTTTYFSQIADTAITTNVAKSGLVLVFRRSGNDVQSLPFQDKSGGVYWYYQVSNGSLRIDVSTNGSRHNFSGQSFSHFVFTPEQISDLEAQGKTRLDLMRLTYDQAVAILR